MSRLGLRLTPHGRLSVEDQDDGPDIDAAASIRLIDAFARGTGYGLVWLGAAEVGQALPPLFVWWRDFAALYVGSLCLHASGMEAEVSRKLPSVPAPTAAELSSLVLTAPIMAGAEYLTQDVLLALWDEMQRAFAASLAVAKVGLQAFLTTLNRAWNLVGRVHFNLAENRRDPDRPFAFMATYTTRLSAQAKVQHVPLGQALREYAGAANRDKLLSLLLPVQRAAEHCAWLKPMIDAGDIFHPLRWGPTEASRFLQSVPELESAGVVVRMPLSWRASRPARPQVTATVGSRAPSAVGLDGLLDFQMGVMLDGEPLTEVEVATLLAGTENLVLLRGQWVEVDRVLLVEQARGANPRPSLLVAPASLLANWAAEIEKFAPGLKAAIVHPSAMPADQVKAFTAEQASDYDLAITSYGSLLRIPVFAEADWRFVILDEAQAIKNPNARQTKAAKALKAKARIVLTGTPVENHFGDLWSIFDFINPGLLGNAKQFTRYTKRLAERTHNPYGPLRELVRPYILRRMKTDKSVIADLSDKTEIKTLCGLSRWQTALYGQAVEDLAKSLEASTGIQRKGIVLAMLMRLKQVCNHPSQWLNDNVWAEKDSGKWARLREIAEVVAARQEKMLVFTQFREMTGPLATFLGQIFGRTGMVLHGQTAVENRKNLVRRFQEDEAVSFFVLSLKAGGTGLTLTAASHVVHFDRWWNPAVENQATDRAFRIGQKKNVLVHKFICRGTVEEKIDALIDSKQDLSDELLTGGDEINLTEMTNDDIMRMVSLDLNSAMKE